MPQLNPLAFGNVCFPILKLELAWFGFSLVSNVKVLFWIFSKAFCCYFLLICWYIFFLVLETFTSFYIRDLHNLIQWRSSTGKDFIQLRWSLVCKLGGICRFSWKNLSFCFIHTLVIYSRYSQLPLFAQSSLDINRLAFSLRITPGRVI